MNRIFRFFPLAALAVTMTACSSDDNIDETPAEIPSQVKGTLFSATISIDNGTTTRTVLTESTDDVTGKGILNVAWRGDGTEQVALIYNGVRDVLTISAVSEGKATISGSLTGEFNTGDAVRIVYPASYAATATDGTNYTADASAFTAQDGTLATIGTSLDVREGTGTLTKSTSPASLSSDVTMDSKIAVWKLTLRNYEQIDICEVFARQLTIKNGDDVIAATTTFASGKDVLYMALPAVSGASLRIEATNAESAIYVLSKSGVSLTASTYYQSTAKMARPLSGAKEPFEENYSQKNPGDVGMVVSQDGRIFKNAATATAAGTSAVAMIAKVSSAGHGLALELNGTPGYASFSTSKTNVSGMATVSGGTWRLTSKQDWIDMLNGYREATETSAPAGGYPTDNMGYAAFKTKYNGLADGVTLQPYTYWTATENSENNNRPWYLVFNGSTASFGNEFIAYNGCLYYLACLAF